MKINFNEIPKFVINLERRPDRLESVKKEFDYITSIIGTKIALRELK